ncbi:MAG: hypothetical protein MJK14_07325, partial [Rivularia sp. ALOHA_DT_140]|nr:hypothetical protein [Rivularia sp. ALOHA_DT_140]
IDVLDEEYQEEYLDLLLEQPNTPTWILVELANVDIEAVTAKAIAKQDSSPIVENFEHFFEQETRFLREIAEHPQVSASILQDLTKYPSSQLKLAIAKNPKTPEQLMISLLQELFENSKYYIKIQIANNPKTPVIILEQLANKSYKLDGTEELLQELAPDITSNLLKRIKTFIYKGQSPEMILFGLGQFSADSLVGGEWTNLVNSLNESELKTLEYLSNQESPLNWEARNTVQTRSSRRRKPSFDNEEMTKNYNMLDGLMHLLNTQYNRDRTNQEIVAALLGNPSVPVNLRERLWERYKTTPDDESEYLEDWDMRMAVAFNPQTSEEKRIEYLQQLLSNQISHIGWFAGEKIHQKIAKNPLTPEFLLKFIVQNRRGGIQDVIKNPNAPVSILREAAKSDNSTTLGLVAEHPNTPKDLLQEMSSTAIVLKNPNLTSLEIYKIQSELQRKHEIQEAEIFMYKRGDNRNISSRNT